MTERTKPWVMRTYSGHSTAVKSNELYRNNLAKGQTGLSIAFDLPTQTGYDPDDPAAAGEVGKVGVPVAHPGHMRQILELADTQLVRKQHFTPSHSRLSLELPRFLGHELISDYATCAVA